MPLIAKTTYRHSPKYLVKSAALLAITPVIIEIIADGGPSHFLDPETGYAMVLFGFVMWPWAFICLIIATKRSLFNKEPVEPSQTLTKPSMNVSPATDAWAQLNDDRQEKKV